MMFTKSVSHLPRLRGVGSWFSILYAIT